MLAKESMNMENFQVQIEKFKWQMDQQNRHHTNNFVSSMNVIEYHIGEGRRNLILSYNTCDLNLSTSKNFSDRANNKLWNPRAYANGTTAMAVHMKTNDYSRTITSSNVPDHKPSSYSGGVAVLGEQVKLNLCLHATISKRRFGTVDSMRIYPFRSPLACIWVASELCTTLRPSPRAKGF